MPFRDDLDRTSANKYGISRQFDKFGIEKLYPSVPGAREFYMPDNLPRSKNTAVKRIENTEMVVHGGGAVTPGVEYYKIEGTAPRLYVYNKNPKMRWSNVEITCHYNKASTSTFEFAGMVLGARSYHHLGGSNAKVYYLKHHFRNKSFYFLKEHEHGGSGNRGYVDNHDSAPTSSLNNNTRNGAKFIVRTTDANVLLQGYKDDTDGNDGGKWRKLVEYTDDGTWNSFAPYMFGQSCMIRTDGVIDFRIKKFSIRTIYPFRDHRR